ncbi:MAG TPA: peptidase M56 [Clostridiaceae bacterium]
MRKLALLFLAMFMLVGYISPYSKQYVNTKYHIGFEYPSSFTQNTKYVNRFEGKDGFFQFDALKGEGTIEKVASYEAFSDLKPYGESPEIEKSILDGQEAILIIPSKDQNIEMKGQAAFIVKYAKPITINPESFNYFILWADKDHIRKIVNSLHFI